MKTVLLFALFGGDCRHVVRQQFVSVDHNFQAIQFQPIAITYPTLVYAAGEQQRLQKLEEIVIQQHEIIQALRQGGQLQATPQGPAISQSQQAAQKIVTASCVKCHSGPTPKGQLDLTDISKLTMAQKLLCVDKAEAGEMPPPPAQAIADDDFQTLRRWALEDRKALREFLKATK